MIRGGSYNNNETNLRSSNRNDNNPSNENNNVGFRPVEAHEEKRRNGTESQSQSGGCDRAHSGTIWLSGDPEEIGMANKKAPPAVSSESERRGRGCFITERRFQVLERITMRGVQV